MPENTAKKSPGFAKRPDYLLEIVPGPARVRIVFNGETIADSHDTMTLRESSYAPVHYFPRADVRMDLLARSTHSTYCPFKGDAAYWTIHAGDRAAENAVWSYEIPFEEVSEIGEFLAFYSNRVDAVEVEVT